MEKIKQFFGKIKDFLKTHEDIRQLVLFTLFSLCAFAIEYVSYLILHFTVAKSGAAFDWFIFHYETGGSGEFAAFLVSNILAQIATFILNRKKTFNADNNIIYAGSMYALMVVGIILLNTWLGGVVGNALAKTSVNQDFAGIVGKLVGSVTSFVISFLMNKFVIMRKVKKPAEDEDKVNVNVTVNATVNSPVDVTVNATQNAEATAKAVSVAEEIVTEEVAAAEENGEE